MEAALGGQNSSPTGLVRLGTSIAGGLVLAPRATGVAGAPSRIEGRPRRRAISPVVTWWRTGWIWTWRVGEIADASLVARRVGQLGRAVVAAPTYLEQARTPFVPDDLYGHTCLLHSSMPEPETWRFTGPDGPLAVRVNGALIANDSVAVLRAARAGHGIALLPEVAVIDDLHSGRLCRLLIDYPSQTAAGSHRLSVASQPRPSHASGPEFCGGAVAGDSDFARSRHGRCADLNDVDAWLLGDSHQVASSLPR